jgi:hypothetical protein
MGPSFSSWAQSSYESLRAASKKDYITTGYAQAVSSRLDTPSIFQGSFLTLKLIFRLHHPRRNCHLCRRRHRRVHGPIKEKVLEDFQVVEQNIF